MSETATLQVKPRGDREIVMTREFDAPRALVFEAFTKPELLKRWLGVFGGWEMLVCEMDLRVGGSYRWVWGGTGAPDMGIRGVFREIERPERIVATESFDEPWYPGEAIVTTELAEQGGKTALTVTILYGSQEARDIAARSDMERGVAASYDKLAEVLASEAT